jgi:regulator of nucleoside diphosphate kinase
MNRNTEILLTELDAARLERSLVDQLRREDAPTQGTAELEALLDEAAVVPSAFIDPKVITMNSTVVIEEVPSGNRTTLTLVYPNEADPERARVSVLSPVGRSLVGARVGETVDVVVPNHPTRQLKVAELTYQPEANGRYDL